MPAQNTPTRGRTRSGRREEARPKKSRGSPKTATWLPDPPHTGKVRQKKASHQAANADEDAEERQGNLDDDIGHGPPPGAVAQGRLEPAEEARAGDEGLGILDLLVEEAAGQLAMESSDPPGHPDGERRDGQPEEGDGQDHAGEQGDGDEGEPDGGERGADGEEGELRPGPPGERLPPDDAGDLLGPVGTAVRQSTSPSP